MSMRETTVKAGVAAPDYCEARVLVLGCGNWLFGDDGFGPAVIEHLRGNHDLPGDVCAIDAGLRAREILFTIVLSERRPRKVIVVDAVDMAAGAAGTRGKPGEVFDLDPAGIPLVKMDDFSMHQVPTSNLLRELRDFCGVTVEILATQVERIPESVEPGLSPSVRDAVPAACRAILSKLG